MIEILIGMISGIVSGTGMGGGTILIFLLTFMMGIEQHVSQATNLIFFIPTSIVAIIINIKNKNIDLKLAIIISIFGILGAIIGVVIGGLITTGFVMMYAETGKMNKKMIMKKGKQLAKKMGIM